MKTNAKCESLGQNICQRMNITPKVIEKSERQRWGRGGGGGALESRKNFTESVCELDSERSKVNC